jgi:hypothetical protein
VAFPVCGSATKATLIVGIQGFANFGYRENGKSPRLVSVRAK